MAVLILVAVPVTAGAAVGDYLGQWGSSGTGNGQFNAPRDVAIGLNGTVYVVDSDNSRIQYFSPDGTYLGQWGTAGMGDDQFMGVCGQLPYLP